MDVNLSKLQETVENRGAWSAVVHGALKSRTWLSNWTVTDYPIAITDYSIVNICFYPFICWWTLRLFPYLGSLVNNVAINIGVHMSFLISVLIFFGHIPRRGIAGSHSSLFFNLRTLHTVSIGTAPIYIPTNGILGFAFLHILANICYFDSILMIVILAGMRWYLMVILNCISLIIGDVEHLSICLYVFLENDFSGLLSIF